MNSYPFIIFLTGAISVGSIERKHEQKLPSVVEYFPEVKGDLTKVVWAHAVNNKSLLNEALKDSIVMMLEGDVVLGVIDGEDEKVVPIMAHPPSLISDLSLKMFLEVLISIQNHSRKGVKLDFKSTDSFKASWEIIDFLKHQINFPFFLNADILPGPIDSAVQPVDPKIFLELSSRKFPTCTLSLGWTTRYAPGIQGKYSEKQLNNMNIAIQNNKVIQPVTLCVRAGIAAQTDGIKNLLNTIDRYQNTSTTTLTIWMSTNSDPVDTTKLKNLILELEKKRVYLDVPKFIQDELMLNGASSISSIILIPCVLGIVYSCSFFVMFFSII